MRPHRLYVKIFLSFLLVLFITELLIFILVIAIPSHRFGRRLEQFARERAAIMQNMVEEMVAAEPARPLADNWELKRFIAGYGKLLDAKIWISDSTQAVVFKSFPDAVPRMESGPYDSWPGHPGRFRFSKRRHMEFYAVIPFSYGEQQQGQVHILFQNRGTPPPLGYFALGLAVVGVVIALLLIPVSRPITRRINQLRQSALRIADGDLSHRVATRGGDEIAELGNAFNQMTAKLKSMISNNKELTANISHELRTPLARIRISEELLRDKIDAIGQDDLCRHLDDIREDILALDLLVGRILELSKLEMQTAPMVLAPLDLPILLRAVIEKYRPSIGQGNFELTVSLPDRLTVSANKEALVTAFSNLLDNAVHYTAQYGRIRVEAETTPDAVEIIVTNTCEKLPEVALTQMFNPFQRVQPSGADRTAVAGSGLGLAIVEKIIKAHGGRIRAGNTPEGLAICIYLPFAME